MSPQRRLSVAELNQVANIAANTAAIWMLQETNAVAGQILGGAGEIVKAASSIDRKLDTVAGAVG